MTSTDLDSAASWPVESSCLAGLIGCGLSDELIAGCYSVDHSAVRLLREHYNLIEAPDLSLQAEAFARSALDLDELSNGVQAAVTYLGSAIKCARRDAKPSATTILLMDKALGQLLRIAKAYQSLQTRVRPAAE
jgi:hypothetical protein